MSWESRNGKGLYYTISRKVGGRVVREYVGTGPYAELIAAQDELARRDRLAAARAWKSLCEQLTLATREIARYCHATDQLVRAALLAAGFHQHDRGEWRRRRHVSTPVPREPVPQKRRARRPLATCGAG